LPRVARLLSAGRFVHRRDLQERDAEEASVARFIDEHTVDGNTKGGWFQPAALFFRVTVLHEGRRTRRSRSVLAKDLRALRISSCLRDNRPLLPDRYRKEPGVVAEV